MDYIHKQNECGIKEGDKVKVIRAALNKENGWECIWLDVMDKCVGGEFTVLLDKGRKGFRLSTGNIIGVDNVFPYFVLELVSGTRTIKEDIIQSIMDEEKPNVVSCSSCAHDHLPSADPMCSVYGECPNYQEK